MAVAERIFRIICECGWSCADDTEENLKSTAQEHQTEEHHETIIEWEYNH